MKKHMQFYSFWSFQCEHLTNFHFLLFYFWTDFGFSKHLFQGDELHLMRGSPLYMAPEIICKGTYDSRVDLWSIGVIIYGLYTVNSTKTEYMWKYFTLYINYMMFLETSSFIVTDACTCMYLFFFYLRMFIWKSTICIKNI